MPHKRKETKMMRVAFFDERDRGKEKKAKRKKKIVAFNQYLLVARVCHVSFTTIDDDDFQNNTT
jgi:hypothetical protein